ncbi:hypothetical protein ACQY0O_008432 [Thecaphora frezii]
MTAVATTVTMAELAPPATRADAPSQFHISHDACSTLGQPLAASSSSPLPVPSPSVPIASGCDSMDAPTSSSSASQLDSLASSDESDTTSSLPALGSEGALESGSSDDDDDEMQLVFFGTPSAAEHEIRRQYEAHIRRKKLIRRDSLDLARRRTLVFDNGDDTDIEDQKVRPPMPADGQDESAAEPYAGTTTECRNASIDTSTSVLQTGETLRHLPAPAETTTTTSSPKTSNGDAGDLAGDESLLANASTLFQLHEGYTPLATSGPASKDELGSIDGSAPCEDVQAELASEVTAAAAENAAIAVQEAADPSAPESQDLVATEQDHDVLASTLPEAASALLPGKDADASLDLSGPIVEGAGSESAEELTPGVTPAPIDEHLKGRYRANEDEESDMQGVGTAQQDVLPEGGLTNRENSPQPSTLGDADSAVDSEDGSVRAESVIVGAEDTDASSSAAPLPGVEEPDAAPDTSASLCSVADEASIEETSDDGADLDLTEDEEIEDEEVEKEALAESEYEKEESVEEEADSEVEGMGEEEEEEEEEEEHGQDPPLLVEKEVRQPTSDAEVEEGGRVEETSQNDVQPSSAAQEGAENPLPMQQSLSVDGGKGEEDEDRRPSGSDSSCLVEEQQAASSSSKLPASPPASSSPVRQQRAKGAEAAILLSRGFVACTPSPGASLHSFSFDISPGVGRALTLPTSGVLQRSAMDDILGSFYDSPRFEAGFRNENVPGPRRSARLSSASSLYSPAKNSSPPQRNAVAKERSVLRDIVPSSQQPPQEQDWPAKAQEATVEPDAFALTGKAELEHPSADDVQKPRSRSRSQSASPKKRRNKSSSPRKPRREAEADADAADQDVDACFAGSSSPSKRKAEAALAPARVASPSVRSALNAWAGAKMVTPYSPEKRAAWALPQAVDLATPLGLTSQQPTPWNMAASLASTSSPVKPGHQSSLSLQPVVEAEEPLAPMSAVDGRLASSQFRALVPSSGARTTLLARNEAEADHQVPLPRMVEQAQASQLRALGLPSADVQYGDLDVTAAPSAQIGPQPVSALHAPRIARTLPSSLPETARAQRSVSAGATSRRFGLRKVEDHPDLIASDEAIDAGTAAPSTVPAALPSTTAITRKPSNGTVSALPRPATAAVSRLPKPASSARTVSASFASANASRQGPAFVPAATSAPATLAPPTTASKLGARLTSSSALRSAVLPSAVRMTATAATPLSATSRALPAPAATVTTATTTATTATMTTATTRAARVPSTEAARTRALGASRVVSARSATTSLRSASTSATAGTGNRAGLSGDAARASPTQEAPSAAAASTVGIEPAPPRLSQLERSQQMQARALARMSPDHGESVVSTALSCAAAIVRGARLMPVDLVPVQQPKEAPAGGDADASLGGAPSASDVPATTAPASLLRSSTAAASSKPLFSSTTSAGRVWSPVKAGGSAARLGLSSSSPVKPPAFLVPSSHLRRPQPGSDSALSSSTSASAVPPSRYGVQVSTGSLAASSSALAASGASTTMRGRAPIASAPSNPFSASALCFASAPRIADEAGSAAMCNEAISAPVAAKIIRPRAVRATSQRIKPAVAEPIPAPPYDATRNPATAAEPEPATSIASTAARSAASQPSALPSLSSSSVAHAEGNGRKGRSMRSAAAAASTKISHSFTSSGLSAPANVGTKTGNGFSFGLGSVAGNNGSGGAAVGGAGQGAISLLPLSAKDLKDLTSRNTRRNEVNVSKLTIKVERRAGPRPPSPSAKLKESVSSAARRKKRTMQAELDDEEREQLDLLGCSGGGGGQVEAEVHVLGKGEDEVYTTPPRLVKPKKGVRWYKPLFVGPSGDEAEANRYDESASAAVRRSKKPRKSSLAPKEYQLDRFGNPPEATLEPLSPRMRKTKVTIKKIVYDGEE